MKNFLLHFLLLEDNVFRHEVLQMEISWIEIVNILNSEFSPMVRSFEPKNLFDIKKRLQNGLILKSNFGYLSFIWKQTSCIMTGNIFYPLRIILSCLPFHKISLCPEIELHVLTNKKCSVYL